MRSLIMLACLAVGCGVAPADDGTTAAAVADPDTLDGVVYLGRFTPAPDQGTVAPVADAPGGLHTYAADFDLDPVAGQTCTLTIYYRIEGGLSGVDLERQVALIASTDDAPLADVPAACERTVCPREDLDPAEGALTYQRALDVGDWRADPGEHRVRYVVKPSGAVVAGKLKVSSSCRAN